MYDKKWLKSVQFSLPVIAIGNLAVGGTGKTPHVAYIANLLEKKGYNVGIISRGYKRRSKGYILADSQSTATTIGDEPMLLATQLPHAAIAVGEDRVLAIPQLLVDCPATQLILLDDAYQHRAVRADAYFLLTTYDNLFIDDKPLPMGRLREPAEHHHRADCIIVTKCPPTLSDTERSQIASRLSPLPHQTLLFSSLQYAPPYALLHPDSPILPLYQQPVVLLCGIAHTQPLMDYLTQQQVEVLPVFYADHHYYTPSELEKLAKKCQAWQPQKGGNPVILTTEKDAMRLLLHRPLLEKLQLPIYVLPIAVHFSPADLEILQTKLTSIFHNKQS